MNVKLKEARDKRWQAGLNSLVGFTRFLRKLELKTPNAHFSSQHQGFLKRMGYKSKSKGALKSYEAQTTGSGSSTDTFSYTSRRLEDY